MIDYEKLGAMIGTAWLDTHPDPHYSERLQIVRRMTEYLDSEGSHPDFRRAIIRTTGGRCYGCGTSHEVGKNEHGILCCEICVGQ